MSACSVRAGVSSNGDLCLLITVGGRLWLWTDIPRPPVEESENRAPTSSDKLLISNFMLLALTLPFVAARPAFPVETILFT